MAVTGVELGPKGTRGRGGQRVQSKGWQSNTTDITTALPPTLPPMAITTDSTTDVKFRRQDEVSEALFQLTWNNELHESFL